MPPTEQTSCADNGSISGDAIETPTDNANHASTRRAMIGALRKDCIGGLSQVRAPRRRDLGPPPSLPVGIVMPSGVSVLARSHDLGTDAGVVPAYEGVVDAAGSARLPALLPPPSGLEHPFVQPVVRVAEWVIAALSFAGSEVVERAMASIRVSIMGNDAVMPVVVATLPSITKRRSAT